MAKLDATRIHAGEVRGWPSGVGRALTVLHITFFISGFCALIYQTAWQRMLGLFGGSDTVSATIVVGAFLFGLGVGSLAGGSFADRLSRTGAVIAFGLCELGIALCAALSPWVFYDLIFGGLAGLAGSQLAVLGVVFAALLPPTLLMGLSLPLLSRAVVRDIAGAAERIGWLYGLNTLGAGLGALLAGCVVIGTVGYEATVYLGALFNAAVGTAALLAAPALRDASAAAKPAAHALRPVGAAPSQGLPWRWCALVFASGFLIISLEILWFRVLGTLAQTNAYAFPIILGVFLLADALGIIAGARVVRGVADPLHLFLRLQGAVAAYALATMILLWAAHDVEAVASLFITGPFELAGMRRFLLSAAAWLAVVGLAVAPPAFLLGMSFPIAQKAVQADPGMVGMRVGTIQLANILGNTAGAVVTGLVLLQVLGSAGTLRAVGALGLLLFVPAFFRKRSPTRRPADFGVAGALAALLILLPGNAAFWARLHLTEAAPAGGAIVAEDRTGVVVLRPASDGMWMFIGGHTQSRLPFLEIHGALGAVGPLLHPAPRSVLMIGHAIGGTPYAAALATRDGAARVRAIEIVAPIYDVVGQAARRDDASVLRHMLADPRIERRVGDGRHAIFADDARYDVIQADAMLPRTSHSGLLYSVAYFRQVRDRLAPGGIAVQWAPSRRVEASFRHVFPHVMRIEHLGSNGTSGILVGSVDGPPPAGRAALAQRFAAAGPGLAAAGWPLEALRRQLLEAPVQLWGPADPPPAEVNTDLFPRDEYFLNGRKLDLLGGGAAAR